MLKVIKKQNEKAGEWERHERGWSNMDGFLSKAKKAAILKHSNLLESE